MSKIDGGAGLARTAARLAGSAAIVGGVTFAILSGPGSAYADTAPYELYCPGTPVGNIAINDVVTTGTITPASPSAGGQFTVTNYQTKASVVATLVSAAAALGNTAIAGSASTTVDATGATPATLAGPAVTFDDPIPSPVPSSGLQLLLPSPAGTVGPFTATGGAIALSVDQKASLTLEVSGNPLALTCTAYPNDAVAVAGIAHTPPTGSPISPPLATATAGGTAAPTTTPTTPSTPTTAAPDTSPSTLPTTGAGPGLYVVGFLGLLALLLSSVVFGVERAQRMLARASSSRRGKRSHDSD